MLAFLFTDAALPAPVLRQLLGRSVEQSFNCISVDSESSTSDTALFCATGAAGNEPIFSAGDRRLTSFRDALDDLTVDLAKQMVFDGEEVQKFFTIAVSGAANARAARKIGISIGNSPALKRGVIGQTLDWRRVMIAVGRSGERADRDRLSIKLGPAPIVADGTYAYEGCPETLAAYIERDSIDIAVDVGVGNGVGTVWTSGLLSSPEPGLESRL